MIEASFVSDWSSPSGFGVQFQCFLFRFVSAMCDMLSTFGVCVTTIHAYLSWCSIDYGPLIPCIYFANMVPFRQTALLLILISRWYKIIIVPMHLFTTQDFFANKSSSWIGLHVTLTWVLLIFDSLLLRVNKKSIFVSRVGRMADICYQWPAVERKCHVFIWTKTKTWCGHCQMKDDL